MAQFSTDAHTRASGEPGPSDDLSKAATLVTVIIPNHNYGDFIGTAIDSALALDWPAVEVIVVDDGSTDHSRQVISAYGERVLSIFQENAGQSVACSAGFARSSGQIVIFLDSDDALEPTLIRELMAVWRPGISKVQFQMKFVDADGKTIVFRGLCASDPDKLSKGEHWNKEYFAAAKSWGANLIRFPVHPAAWRSQGDPHEIAT